MSDGYDPATSPAGEGGPDSSAPLNRFGIRLTDDARAWFAQYTDLDLGGLQEGPFFPKGMQALLVLDAGDFLRLPGNQKNVNIHDQDGAPYSAENPLHVVAHDDTQSVVSIEGSTDPNKAKIVQGQLQVQVHTLPAITFLTPQPVTLPEVTAAKPLPVLPSIGAAAATPLYVHVVNQPSPTPGAGGLVPVGSFLLDPVTGQVTGSNVPLVVERSVTIEKGNIPTGATFFRVWPRNCVFDFSPSTPSGDANWAKCIGTISRNDIAGYDSAFEAFTFSNFEGIPDSTPPGLPVRTVRCGPLWPVDGLTKIEFSAAYTPGDEQSTEQRPTLTMQGVLEFFGPPSSETGPQISRQIDASDHPRGKGRGKDPADPPPSKGKAT